MNAQPPTDRPSARLNQFTTSTSDSSTGLIPTLPLPRSGSPTGRRAAQARSVRERLSDRDLDILVTLARLRLVTGRQIQRLYLGAASPLTAARRSRAILRRLTSLRVVVRLDRRVGGVRAGSDGHLYGLSGLGRAALNLTDMPSLGGRPIGSTKSAFQDHMLAVSELYVRLHELQRTGVVQLLAFLGEPDCWRGYPGPGGGRVTLKPDAFVALGVGDYEQYSFIELDLGTESRPTLLRKCQRYVDYWRSGMTEHQGGVFPRVWWLAPTARRVGQIREVISRLAPEHSRLFALARIDDAAAQLGTPDESGDES